PSSAWARAGEREAVRCRCSWVRAIGLPRRAAIEARSEAGQAMRRAALALVLALALPARAADKVAPPARPAETTVPWDQTEDHVGETVVVEGRGLGVACSQLSFLLAFDPTFNRFTAVVQAEHFDRFPPDQLDALYSGRKVQVRGTIVTRDRKPEILLSDPADLKLAESKEDKK